MTRQPTPASASSSATPTVGFVAPAQGTRGSGRNFPEMTDEQYKAYWARLLGRATGKVKK